MFIATGRSERNAAATAAPPIASAVNIFINTAYEYENNVHKCESTLNVRRFMASWQIAVRSKKILLKILDENVLKKQLKRNQTRRASLLQLPFKCKRGKCQSKSLAICIRT